MFMWKGNLMQSRVVLVLSLFALAFVIVLGSLALHFTSDTASASTEAASEDQGQPSPYRAGDEAASRASNLDEFRDTMAPNQPPPDAANVELTLEERQNADSLATLLRKVHQGFDPEGAVVNNAMIPYLAEMITVVNQHDHLHYLIEIVEPDGALARRRAQTLNDVLRLNVLQPSKLHIVGRQGAHAAHVDVSAQ